MAKKENKGGWLRNDEVEKDNAVKGKNDQNGQYSGMQDTGDKGLRQLGSRVQQADGTGDDTPDDDNETTSAATDPSGRGS